MLNDEALNAAEVAAILHIGRNAVYDMAKAGTLPSYRIGRKLFFALKDIQAYLDDARRGGASDAAGGEVGAGGGVPSESAARAEGRAMPSCADPDGATPPIAASARLLDPASGDDGFIIAGLGLAADLLVDRLEQLGVTATRAYRASYSALVDLYSGAVDAALVHLYDQRTNTYNVPFVQRLAPGTPVVVFRLVQRWQGFAVAPGNPKGIASWGALLRPGVRLANRARGCGSRVLLDEKLIAMEADPASLAGYEHEYATGLGAANAVAAGAADVAVIGEHIAAHANGVDFVPLQMEWLDIAVAKHGRGRQLSRHLRTFFADPAFCGEYRRVVHGDADRLGSIIYEC